jgi:hypothetical protein
MSNPDLAVNVTSEFTSLVPQSTCGQLYESGLNKEMTIEQCITIVSNVVCGCSNTLTPSVNPVSAPYFGICFVCAGDPNAMISNPDYILNIPPQYDANQPQASCAQLYTAGLAGEMTLEQCDVVLTSVNEQQLCGCSNAM